MPGWAVSEAASAGEGEKKKARKWGVVIVQIDDFPPVDPGRKLVYHVRPTESRARKMTARMALKMPEHRWSHEMLLAVDIRKMKRAPFVSPELGIEVKLSMV